MEEITGGFCGTGVFLDEEDLQEKYKNKPGRAQMIMSNAKTIVCQVAELTL